MAGEMDLQKLLSGLTTDLVEGVFVFVTLPEGDVPQGLSPRMMFKEAEGVTLILLEEQAQAHGLAYEFPSRMITLNVHSALEAVGFIAHIATVLASQQMGVNPVAGFYHDHLFVPKDRAQDALDVLAQIARDATAATP
jgi:hypothetical protein